VAPVRDQRDVATAALEREDLDDAVELEPLNGPKLMPDADLDALAGIELVELDEHRSAIGLADRREHPGAPRVTQHSRTAVAVERQRTDPANHEAHRRRLAPAVVSHTSTTAQPVPCARLRSRHDRVGYS